jgi:drug/metabolite transporter (DMT)-like permease
VIIQEPVTRRQAAGAVLGLIGVTGLISDGSISFLLRLQFNPGDLFLVVSAGIWAFYPVFARRVMRNRPPLPAMVLSTLPGLPLLAVAALIELHYIPLNLRWETILAIAHICLVPTVAGFWFWNRAVDLLGAGGAMVFYNTLPLYGVMLGSWMLGEALGAAHFIFGGLILAGGLYAALDGQGRRKML